MAFFKRLLKSIRYPFHSKQRRRKTSINHVETRVSNSNVTDPIVNDPIVNDRKAANERETQNTTDTVEQPSDNITQINVSNSDDDEGKKEAIIVDPNPNPEGGSFGNVF